MMRPSLYAPTATAVALLGLALPACKKSEPAAPAPAPAPVAVAPAPAPKPVPVVNASVSGQSAPDCVGPFSTTGVTKTFKAGRVTATQTGAVVSFADADEDKVLRFGVLANTKEVTGENLLNLKKYLQFFAAEKVDALLLAGDIGEFAPDLTVFYTKLAEAGVPMLVIPGNREPRENFNKAVAQVQGKFPQVINMAQVRLVKWDDGSVMSLPGYYDRRFIHSGADGCQYFKEDVDGLAGIAAAATQPTVLLSHAEPQGQGAQAIDFRGDSMTGNTGDANLTALLRKAGVHFGIAANMHEASGRATDLDSNVVREGELKAELFLNAGDADSVPWKLNDGTDSYGMVSVLTVQGTQASYKIFRAPQITEEEQVEARKLKAALAGAE